MVHTLFHAGNAERMLAVSVSMRRSEWRWKRPVPRVAPLRRDRYGTIAIRRPMLALFLSTLSKILAWRSAMGQT